MQPSSKGSPCPQEKVFHSERKVAGRGPRGRGSLGGGRKPAANLSGCEKGTASTKDPSGRRLSLDDKPISASPEPNPTLDLLMSCNGICSRAQRVIVSNVKCSGTTYSPDGEGKTSSPTVDDNKY